MSDIEFNPLDVGSDGNSLADLSARPQCSQRIDYHFLNYDLMDAQDAYYIALILDPRFKTLLLEKELGEDAAIEVITSIKKQLHKRYSSKSDQDSSAQREQNTKPQSIEDYVLQKLQPQKKQRSDIDRYFEEDLVTIHESVTKEKDWLFSWWRMYRDEYPRMAAAA